MAVDRKDLYRFPWSMTDNPGGWVEVTDSCNLACPGCYRQRREGHRPVEDVYEDIKALQKITNCDFIKISGGEPLLYPHLVEVVRFICRSGMKAMVITNGLELDRRLAQELVEAGLRKFSFHIDSAQERPGWEGKNEGELNDLRQHYADLMGGFENATCGFVATVFRSNLADIPHVVEWALKNIHKVSHLSFIARRGILIGDGLVFYADGRKLEPDEIPNRCEDADDIAITSELMLDTIRARFPGIRPCAYIGGTAAPETNKYLVSVNVGTPKRIYGALGPKTVEINQVLRHLIKSKYATGVRRQKAGRKIFLLSFFDPAVRESLGRFLKACLRNPAAFFEKIYTQPLALEQPVELIEGETNLCDGCINMMIYRGRLIPSCRLDEYRVFGSAMVTQKTKAGREDR
jgi:hypothetical protein